MGQLKEVKLVSTGIYLGGKPVSFEEVENVIGEFKDIPPKMKIMIPKLKNIMKKILKGCCYFAIDPEKNKPMETVTSLSVKAIKKALEKASMKPQELEYILFRNNLRIDGIYTDLFLPNAKYLSFLLPLIKLQFFLKRKRSQRKQGPDYLPLHKTLLLPEILYGRHLIIKASKKE